MNWAAIFLVLGIISILAIMFFWIKFHKFSICQRLGKKSKILSWLLALVPVLVIIICTYFMIYAMVIVILHLLVIWILADLVGAIVQSLTHRRWSRYWQGLAAILFTAIYLTGGWYTAHHVVETDYRLSGSSQDLRIAMIADSHLGATFDGEGFAKHIETIKEQNPDILVIVGDYVDDDTKREDMLVACQALGDIQCPYGKYYVFGNHDRGYFNSRDFNTEELVASLEKNGVTVLQDQLVDLGDIVLLGREDKSVRSRQTMEQLAQKLDKNKYTIVLDHQPSDYDNEAAAGVDLVLSGHTHGGWLFPMAYISKYIGPDDWIYGETRIENTSFIVTSGISDWALPFKTGTKAEFLIIDLESK